MNTTHQDLGTEHLVGRVPLATGETLRLVDPRAVYVYVEQGDVWITEERSATDVVLAAAAGFRLMRPGAAVVEALTPAILLLTSPRKTGFAREMTTIERPPYPQRGRESAPAADVLAGLRGRWPAWLLALARQSA